MASQKFGGGEALAALELERFEDKAARAATHADHAGLGSENVARRAGGRIGFGRVDFQGLVGEVRGGPGPGRHRADPRGKSLGGLAPIEKAVGFFELRRVGGEGAVLRNARGVSLLQKIEGFEQAGRGEVGEAVVELTGGFVGADGELLGEEDVAGVEALVHIHHGDAGLVVAGEDGGVDRRGAAVARKERGVEIEAAEARGFEDALGEDLAVGGDDHEVGHEDAEVVQRRGGAEFFGLLDGEVLGEGDLFDGGHSRLQIPASWLVGLRNHANDGVFFRGQKSLKSGRTDCTRAAKNDSHGLQGRRINHRGHREHRGRLES